MDANIDALGNTLARQNLQQNVTQYASVALVQSIEIAALESLGDDLDEPGQAELTARRRELKIAEAKRSVFQEWLASIPGGDSEA